MSRLTIELKAGVFVGNIGRRVREKIWERIIREWKANALMIYTTNNEQGYAALSNGDTSREIVEMEGMILTQFIHNRKTQMRPLPPEDGDESPVEGDMELILKPQAQTGNFTAEAEENLRKAEDIPVNFDKASGQGSFF